MDLYKYQTELDKIEKKIPYRFFYNYKVLYLLERKKLLNLIADQDYEERFRGKSFFLHFLKNNFLALCKYEHSIIGMALRFTIFRGVRELLDYIVVHFINYFSYTSEENIIKIETSYKDYRSKLFDYLNANEVQEDDFIWMIKHIELLSKKPYYDTAKYLTEKLFYEIILSIQLYYYFSEWDHLDYKSKNIFKSYPYLYRKLNRYNKKPKLHSSLISLLLNDLDLIYTKIEELRKEKESYSKRIIESEKSKEVKEKPIYIKVRATSKDESNNEITINGIFYNKVPNTDFDFLYYLLWHLKEFPDKKPGIKLKAVIPNDHIKLITDDYDILNRFSEHTWNTKSSFTRSKAKVKANSHINEILRTHLKLPFDAIELFGKSYILVKEIRPENIELVKFIDSV